MKTIIGAIALTLSLPAMAQTAPAADPQADQLHCQAAQGQQQDKASLDDAQKNCRTAMNYRARKHRAAKTEAERITAEVNGNGHQGHKH